MLTTLSNFSRRSFIPLRVKLYALAICFIIAAAGQLYMRGHNAGIEAALDDCYGMPCTDYTMIIGQASKAPKKPAAPKEKRVASVWEAIQ